MRNDLLRICTLAARNEEGLDRWRARWARATGKRPDVHAHVCQQQYGLPFPLQGHWPTAVECWRRWFPAAVATNANIIPIPHHRRQYLGVTLPAGPDEAA